MTVRTRSVVLAIGAALAPWALVAAGPEGGPAAAPILAVSATPPALENAAAQEGDALLPINLATALRLADARPLVVQAAQVSVAIDLARLARAEILWLPTVYAGADYQRHDGAMQGTSGSFDVNSRNQLLLGVGAQAVFAATDAIFEPLAARREVAARQIGVQAARNDALVQVAEAFFQVQQARGRLAGYQDSLAKARELVRKISSLGQALVPALEAERARTTLYELEQQAAQAREDWRFASATLTRLLRLRPGVIVAPAEPPHLQVTLVNPDAAVDQLIPIGLTNRPELAAQQEIVQATLIRLKQEKLRPLIPSLVLQSAAVPGNRLGAGAYSAGKDDYLNRHHSRSDWDVEILWEFRNLGFGNLGLIEERRGQHQQALIDLFRVQDLIASEVVQAQAQVEGAGRRLTAAEAGLKSAKASYEGNVRGLSETVRLGQVLTLVNRPQEVLSALTQLQQAYNNFFAAVNDYNRAQFRLFRAMGYPAEGVAHHAALGQEMPLEETCVPPGR
jgi:outer membrane protein TolC